MRGKESREARVGFSASDLLSRKAAYAHFQLFVQKKELDILLGLREGELLMTNYAESHTTVKYIVY